jgi:hypothetical protein
MSLDPYADDFDWASPDTNVLLARWPELCDMVAYAIVPALDRLITDPAGFPSSLTDATESEEEAEKLWHDILTAIKGGFEAHIALEEFAVADRERAVEERKEGLALFAKHFPHLWS